VPISLASEHRTVLRAHFRLLINKPVHHDALYALLRGLRTAPPLPSRPPIHFDLHVLLVEDNPVNQRLMQKVLGNLGCRWTIAENGRRAVEALAAATTEFNLVLMDLHMPELDGLGAIREIREGKAGLRAQTVWIAALTADARDDQRQRAFEAGANDYLTKPLRLPELEASMRRSREARGGKK
jgi:CheY-like chemotaxis protein